MELDDLKAMIDAAAASDRPETVFNEHGWTLRLVRQPTDVAPLASATIDAPIGGLLHLQSAPGAPAFVAVGLTIQPGDPLFVIEAMKVFNTIRADRAGLVAAILVADGIEVEAGQPLMRLA